VRPTFHIITVCVNYSDLLRIALPTWRSWADHIVVVTTSADAETHALCKSAGVTCAVNNNFYHDGCAFDKGFVLAQSLQWWKDNLPWFGKPGHWILHLDADTLLPERSRVEPQLAHLDRVKLYGCKRWLCDTWEQYELFQRGGRTGIMLQDPLQRTREVWGYFQLGESRRWAQVCPEMYLRNVDASKCDCWTARRWGFAHQALIRGLEAVHLGKTFTNHKGRVTPAFGPARSEHGQENTSERGQAALANA
jgi:hypothetical protein